MLKQEQQAEKQRREQQVENQRRACRRVPAATNSISSSDAPSHAGAWALSNTKVDAQPNQSAESIGSRGRRVRVKKRPESATFEAASPFSSRAASEAGDADSMELEFAASTTQPPIRYASSRVALRRVESKSRSSLHEVRTGQQDPFT